MKVLYIVSSIFLYFIACAYAETITNTNHHATCMSYGCTVNYIKEEIKEIGGTTHQILSWNIQGEDIANVCQYLSQLELKVINLQRVTNKQLVKLKQTCLRKYNVSGIPAGSKASDQFNAIFYLNDRTQLMEVEEGTLSSRQCKQMVWSRLSFQVSKPATNGLTKRSLSANLFAILSGKTMLRKLRNRGPLTHHQKKVLFVNVYVDKENAESTLHECLRDIYKHINGRRRYRTILSGNIGSNEKVVLGYPRPTRPIFKYCGPGLGDDKMCISNRGRRDTFQYRLTAVIHTNAKNNPSLTVFSI